MRRLTAVLRHRVKHGDTLYTHHLDFVQRRQDMETDTETDRVNGPLIEAILDECVPLLVTVVAEESVKVSVGAARAHAEITTGFAQVVAERGLGGIEAVARERKTVLDAMLQHRYDNRYIYVVFSLFNKIFLPPLFPSSL
jgi:hypothetical protein